DEADREHVADRADTRTDAEVERPPERPGEVGVDGEGRHETERDEPEAPHVGGVVLQRAQKRRLLGRAVSTLDWPPPLSGGHSDHRRYQQPHQQQVTHRSVSTGGTKVSRLY